MRENNKIVWLSVVAILMTVSCVDSFAQQLGRPLRSTTPTNTVASAASPQRHPRQTNVRTIRNGNGLQHSSYLRSARYPTQRPLSQQPHDADTPSPSPSPSTSTVRLSAAVSNNDHEERHENQQQKGSLLGAALLFAGTAIGAGMLALPAETAPAGFVPSIASLVFCWAFTYVTSLVTLEATWSVVAQLDQKTENGPEAEEVVSSVGFLSVSRRALGPWGERVTAVLFWFLLSAIVVAYTSEGGELLSQAFRDLTASQSTSLSPNLGSTCFMIFFGSFAVFGTEKVDIINRILVAGFITAFAGLVSVGLPTIHTTALTTGVQNWNAIYPGATSVGILAFGAQNVVPTLLQYLGGDAERTRKAILGGSLLPLAMYTLWETVFFGLAPADATASAGSKIDVVRELGASGGPSVQVLVKLFSACAVGSSMAGASVSLVDFFQDALSSSSSGTGAAAGGMGQRLVAATFALGPPLGLACVFPQAFLGALENAGLIGGVSLYGVIPALAVLRLRDQNGIDGISMPGKLSGGSLALGSIVVLSAALVLPEFVRLVETNFVSAPL